MLTLDYELFFGKNSGSINECIIDPTQRIIEILNKWDIKASFFVDAGYIERLDQERRLFPELERDYKLITDQILALYKEGHDIQLHIHPHWRDSYYGEKGWEINTSRYKLHDFSQQEVNSIVSDYKKVLEKIIADKIFTYRAGGWCILPFEHISESLYSNGILIDSTVFRNGYYHSDAQSFDFRMAEDKTIWKFDENPNIEDKNGRFMEIPISSIKTSPFFYWRLAIAKKFGGKKHKAFGNGRAVKANRKSILRMLACPSTTVVSIDGYKSSLLSTSLKEYGSRFNEDNYFVAIGHPKAASEFSLMQLEQFIDNAVVDNKFTTYRLEYSKRLGKDSYG